MVGNDQQQGTHHHHSEHHHSEHHHHHHRHKHHRHRHRGGRERSKLQMIIVAALIVGVYLAIILGIRHYGSQIDERGNFEVRGSLEGRYEPAMSLSYNGQRFTYRDSSLTTLLLIGVDNETLDKTDSGLRSGGQADFLVLLVSDRKEKKVTPIQLDRDTMTEIDVMTMTGEKAGTREAQLCLAQAFGNTLEENCRNTVSSVRRYLRGIPIDHYMVFDMASISTFNDLLGGVPVTVMDDLSAADPSLTVGTTVILHGDQAETYVRSRMTVGDGTNASRMQRQRAYLDAATRIIQRKMEDDAAFGETLIRGMSGNFSSDMDSMALVNLIYQMSRFDVVNFKVPEGTYSVGSDGFREFHPDMDSVTDILVRTCFE